MQILYQKSDGSRINITQSQLTTMQNLCKHKLVNIIDDKHVKVVSLPENIRLVPDKPLTYGGSYRQRQPFEELSSYKNIRELGMFHSKTK